jgi:Family of unknown function (DUF6130)
VNTRWSILVATAVLVVAGGCANSAGTGGGSSPTTPISRPSSPARLTIVAPRNGEVVKASNVRVRLRLQGGRVIRPTSQHITPTTGHIHVSLDNRIVSMNYGLSDRIRDVKPGTHVLRVEFVASDHLPFDPRVVANSVFRVTK